MKSYISLFVMLWFLSTALGETIIGQLVDGPCSRFNINSQKTFFKNLFIGTWYVYASYDYSDIRGLDCLVASYQLTPNGNAINNENGKDPTCGTSFQSDFHFDRPGVGHYTYKKGNLSSDIIIPSTDYIYYYIEFACRDIAGGKSDCYIGIFTRMPVPNAYTLIRINAFLDAHHIDRTKLRYIVHDETRCSQ